MAKFVRWLGAFGEVTERSPAWELTQAVRQVAAEPLYRGKSVLLSENDRITLGFVIDEAQSHFIKGFMRDCYSDPSKHGVLEPYATYEYPHLPVGEKSIDRFLKNWSKSFPKHHGECFFDLIVPSAIALRKGADHWALAQAKALSEKFGLPIQRIEELKKM